jgi:cyanophycinase-like exopeptidase
MKDLKSAKDYMLYNGIKGLGIFICCIYFIMTLEGQNYISYHIGNEDDKIAKPIGGICLMGGSSENDEAMKWFLRRAKGGDVLVLRASGSDGYNDYLFNDLGISVNSVESIVFKDSSASYEKYIHEKIKNAEAIWFAGGNQWKYVSYWRGTPIDSLINEGIQQRNVVIGGTSAGMAILGSFIFSAENGTIKSFDALANPYHKSMVVDSARLLKLPILANVITDTHYAQRERQGRHVGFLARIFSDYDIKAKGIGADERIAICIDEKGIARVYGNYPERNHKAYFLQMNDEIRDVFPEKIKPETALEWKKGEKAIKVYAVFGTVDGKHSFDLNDWKSGKGGNWEYWYIENGEWKFTLSH